MYSNIRQYISKGLWACLYLTITIYLIIAVRSLITTSYFYITNWQTYNASEFLVNYQGGFIRRGLIGQLIYLLCKYMDVDPRLSIAVICTVPALILIFFLVWKFLKCHISWIILPTTFCLGFLVEGFVRKDALSLCLVVAMLYVCRIVSHGYLKVLWVTLLGTLAILIYEPAFFMFFPLVFLTLYSDRHNTPRIGVMAYGVMMLALMAVMLRFSGSTQTACDIWESWRSLCPDITPAEQGATVKSIGWSVTYALEFNESFLLPTKSTPYNLAYVTILFVVTTYTYINYPFAFAKESRRAIGCSQPVFASLVMLQILSLAPMFMGLSCDFGRLFPYIFITSMAAVFILPTSLIESMFPVAVTRFADHTVCRLCHAIPHRSALICMIILFVGIPYTRFNMGKLLTDSVIYHVFDFIF